MVSTRSSAHNTLSYYRRYPRLKGSSVSIIELFKNPGPPLDDISLDSRSQFPQLIKQFNRQAPEVLVHADVASMTDIERMVLNDNADVGFIPYHRQLDGLDYIHLYSAFVIFTRPQNTPSQPCPPRNKTNKSKTIRPPMQGLNPMKKSVNKSRA